MFIVLFKVKTIESKSQLLILEISMSVAKKKWWSEKHYLESKTVTRNVLQLLSEL